MSRAEWLCQADWVGCANWVSQAVRVSWGGDSGRRVSKAK